MDNQKGWALQYNAEKVLDGFSVPVMIGTLCFNESNAPYDIIIDFANKAFGDFTHKDASDVIGKKYTECFPNVTLYHLNDYYKAACFDEKSEFTVENIYTGTPFRNICYPAGQYGQFVCSFIDIAKEEEFRLALEYRNEFDPLTEIYNRSTFFRAFSKLLETAKPGQLALVRINVGHFKVINDLYGAQKGDNLLKHIAKIFIDKLDDCIYGRIVNDNFEIVIENTEKNLIKTMNILDEGVKNYPMDYDIHLFYGIYVVDDLSVPVSIMSDRSHIAMNSINGEYMRRYAYYDEKMRQEIIVEQEISSQMEAALYNRQFAMYLQPKCSLTDGRVIGAEALVRWKHPIKGVVSPSTFIPLFEKNGFIIKLDEFMWDSACQYLNGRLARGDEIVPISVNVSRRHLYSATLIQKLEKLLTNYHLDKKYLQLEITESLYSENPSLLTNAIKQLRKAGFTVLMDDFGSGYSSLNMLKDIEVDILKLDMRFLSDENTTGRGGSILASVIRMAKWIDMDVIAEGVETIQQASFLKSVGCFEAQGYLFSKPMETAEFDAYMKREGASLERTKTTVSSVDYLALWDHSFSNTIITDYLTVAVSMYESVADGASLELIRANNVYYELMGDDFDDFNHESRNILKKIYEPDLPIVEKLISDAVSQDKIVKAIYRRYTRDNKIIWICTSLRAVYRMDGRNIFVAIIDEVNDMMEKNSRTDAQRKELAELINQIPVGVCVFDWSESEKPNMVYLNENVGPQFGISSSSAMEAIKENGLKNYIGEAEYNKIKDDLTLCAKHKTLYSKLHSYTAANGQLEWIRIRSTVVQRENEGFRAYAVIENVTEEMQIERKLNAQRQLQTILLEKTNMAVFDADITAQTSEITFSQNNVRTSYVRYYGEDVNSSLDAIHISDRKRLLDIIDEMKHQPCHKDIDFRCKFNGKDYIWSRGYFVSLADENGRVYRIVGRIQDIDQEKIGIEHYKQMANLDPMTQLLNKVAFSQLMEKSIQQKPEGQIYAVLMIDLDNFKIINDALGHIYGDTVLKRVAAVMREVFSKDCTCCRFGGDEFMVLIKNTDSKATVTMVERFYQRLNERQRANDEKVYCSVGVAYANKNDLSAEDVVRQADNAMYTAKKKGKNCFIEYMKVGS